MWKVKLVGFLALCLTVSTVQFAMSTTIQPQVTATLALEQLKNPSLQTDTALRTWNTNNTFGLVWGGVSLLGLYLVYTERKLFTNEKT